MDDALKKALQDLVIPKANLVHPDDCSCSRMDLREFGCLCGSSRPPQKTSPRLIMSEDRSGSIDNELFDEFLKLLGELDKK